MLKPLLFIAELCRRNKKKRQNMKVITMESSAYKAMMEQIAEVAGYVREIREAMKRENTDRLLDTNEAARELGVSKRTLQRMRDDHRIRYVVLRRKCQYRLSEIRRILDSHTIREDGTTLEELHHNSRLPTGNGRQPKGRRT